MATFIKFGTQIINMDLVIDGQWNEESHTMLLHFTTTDPNVPCSRQFSGDTGEKIRLWFDRNAVDLMNTSNEILDYQTAVMPEDEGEGKQKSVLACPASFYTD